MWTLRVATLADVPEIRTLMDRAIQSSCSRSSSPAAIEASVELMGLDTQLIDRRHVLRGRRGRPDHRLRRLEPARDAVRGRPHGGRSDALLDPARDAARVRAMYTDPDHARRGIGRAILGACEVAARAEGFLIEELVATLAGEPLYRACGFTAVEAFDQSTEAGIAVPLIRMTKRL